ncbi:MAG TPA: SxtJ family membrane protein [Bryobacteraceae bacterium]|nr:SxtJ family membrane protein [Bryobacteraceae bacterium]
MSTHEDFSRHAEVRGSSDRAFGFVIAAFFLLVALAPLRYHAPARWWALALAVALLATASLRPSLLHQPNQLWTKLGLLLGRVMTPVVTALLFFLIVTPVALLLRALGKDPLRRVPDAGAKSYWIERQPAGPPPDSMVNQF